MFALLMGYVLNFAAVAAMYFAIFSRLCSSSDTVLPVYHMLNILLLLVLRILSYQSGVALVGCMILNRKVGRHCCMCAQVRAHSCYKV